MATNLPIEPRWVVGVIALVVVGGLMYAGTIPSDMGMTVIVAVLGGLGLYERRGRKQVEAQLRNRGGT